VERPFTTLNGFLAIIPARAGSKGIPFKNMCRLGDRPLIGHAIRAALDARHVTRVIVSTDSREIADYASHCGAPTRRLRPADLSADAASTAEVVRYEIDRHAAETGELFDHLMLLQPTSPLRTSQHIDAAATCYLAAGARSLISVCEAGPAHPDYMYRVRDGLLEKFVGGQVGIPRQQLEKLYLRNGAIYITARAHFDATGSLVSSHPAYYVMDRKSSINIDEPDDLMIAEALLRH
jgi:CMP-N-acetylneuraminic acid synthetase